VDWQRYANPLTPNASSSSALEARFHKLRAQWLEAYAAYEKQLISLRVKYGGHTEWASRGEQKKLEQLDGRVKRLGEKIFALVQKASPRDWSYGVPAGYIYRDVPWEDVVRPVGEPLSRTPPLAYGQTEPFR
jgi:hypothetical protein